jgi:hypothetical protein
MAVASAIDTYIKQSNDSVRLKAEETLVLGNQFGAKYTEIAKGAATAEIYAIQINHFISKTQAICEYVGIPCKEQIFETRAVIFTFLFFFFFFLLEGPRRIRIPVLNFMTHADNLSCSLKSLVRSLIGKKVYSYLGLRESGLD